MRLMVLLPIVLAGCVTVSVVPPSKMAELPVFPSKSRAPAAAKLNSVRFAQLFCVDQNFYFKAETAPTNYPNNPNCLVLGEEEMNSPVPVQLNFRSKVPEGNFADIILVRVLNYEDKSFREMATKELREYEIRTGQCGSKLFFLVSLASKKQPEIDPRMNSAASYCRFDQPEKVLSHWPLAGVYPRVYGEPTQNFKTKLGIQSQGI